MLHSIARLRGALFVFFGVEHERQYDARGERQLNCNIATTRFILTLTAFILFEKCSFLPFLSLGFIAARRYVHNFAVRTQNEEEINSFATLAKSYE